MSWAMNSTVVNDATYYKSRAPNAPAYGSLSIHTQAFTYVKVGKYGGAGLDDLKKQIEGFDVLQAFFGVFDGHGGSKAAEGRNGGGIERCGDAIEEAIKEAYLTPDMDFLKEDVGGSTCCVTAMIHKGDLVVSNPGDCRAVLSRNGVAEALTSDHHVSRQDERARIEALGGYVDFCHGVWRIQGSLAVSRAIGNKHLKQWVIAEPETKSLKIQPECEFLILASDDLWNKVTNQEAVNLVRPFCVDIDKPEPFSACKKLAELSSWRGPFGDISVMIIQLERLVSRPV
ncbi:hypothetical protein Gotur_028000 [Gossypium turneri]